MVNNMLSLFAEWKQTRDKSGFDLIGPSKEECFNGGYSEGYKKGLAEGQKIGLKTALEANKTEHFLNILTEGLIKKEFQNIHMLGMSMDGMPISPSAEFLVWKEQVEKCLRSPEAS